MSHKMRVIATSWLLGAIMLTTCQSTKKIGTEVSVDGGSYRVVSVAELQTMLKNKEFVMANVHIPWQGDIPLTAKIFEYPSGPSAWPVQPLDT